MHTKSINKNEEASRKVNKRQNEANKRPDGKSAENMGDVSETKTQEIEGGNSIL